MYEALVIIAGGGLAPAEIGVGHAHVMQLQEDMHMARKSSLLRLGFDAAQAEALSALHTRNFM
jgi:hypothetical protein